MFALGPMLSDFKNLEYNIFNCDQRENVRNNTGLCMTPEVPFKGVFVVFYARPYEIIETLTEYAFTSLEMQSNDIQNAVKFVMFLIDMRAFYYTPWHNLRRAGAQE